MAKPKYTLTRFSMLIFRVFAGSCLRKAGARAHLLFEFVSISFIFMNQNLLPEHNWQQCGITAVSAYAATVRSLLSASRDFEMCHIFTI